MARQLTNEIRQVIITRVLKATFEKREKVLTHSLTDFADRAYLMLMPPQFLAVVDSLPKEWFQTREYMEIRFTEKKEDGSDVVRSIETPLHILNEAMSRRGEKHLFRLSTGKPFPHSLTGYENARVFLDGNPSAKAITNEVQALEKIASAIKADREGAKTRLTELLYSIRTVQRLVEVAPELKPFIPASAFEERAPMPAPIVGSLITDLMKAGLKLQQVEA